VARREKRLVVRVEEDVVVALGRIIATWQRDRPGQDVTQSSVVRELVYAADPARSPEPPAKRAASWRVTGAQAR